MLLSRRALVLVVLIGLLAAACGSSGPEAPESQAIAPLEGEFATLDGASVDLAALEGQDVVLWFWAPW